jgi:hypothetical protein
MNSKLKKVCTMIIKIKGSKSSTDTNFNRTLALGITAQYGMPSGANRLNYKISTSMQLISEV